LQRRKYEEEAKKREIQKIFAESEVLKTLNNKISIGFVNKERTKQLAEKQIKVLSELVYY